VSQLYNRFFFRVQCLGDLLACTTATRRVSTGLNDWRTKTSEQHLQPLITANVLSAVIAVLLAGLVYCNYVIWKDYLEIVAWAFLLSQALYAPQRSILAHLQRLRNLPEGHRRPPPTPGKTIDGDSSFLVHLQLEIQAAIRSHTWKDLLAGVGHFLLAYSFVGFTVFLSVTLLNRVVSATAILGCLTTAAITIAVLVYVLDYRCLRLWTPLIADESLVALLLAFGALGSMVVIFVFLGIQSFIELYQAVTDAVEWTHDLVYEHDSLAPLYDYGKDTARGAYKSVKLNYQGAEWWPVVSTLEESFTRGYNLSATHQLCRWRLAPLYANTTWWEPADTAIRFTLQRLNRRSSLGQVASEASRLVTALVHHSNSHPADLVRYAFGLAANPIVFLQSAVRVLTSFLMLASNWGVQIVFFVYFLIVMLNREDDMLGMLVTVLFPAGHTCQEELAETLRAAVQGVFYLPVQLASIHAGIMFVTLKVVGMRYAYLLTSLVFITSLLPLFSPLVVLFLICAFLTLPFWLGSSLASLVKPLIIFAIDASLFYYLDEKIYSESERSGRVDSPLLTAFSMALGVATFGWRGVVVGPLLLCLLLVACKQRLLSSAEAPSPPSPAVLGSPAHLNSSSWLNPSSPRPIIVEVALHTASGRRYRVPVPADVSWDVWCQSIQKRLRLPRAPTELLTASGAIVNATDVLLAGELLVIPDP